MESTGTALSLLETLGAMAAITMIILTSDVTSAGIFFFLASKRCQGLCSVLTEKINKDLPPQSVKLLLSNETKYVLANSLYLASFLFFLDLESNSASSK